MNAQGRLYLVDPHVPATRIERWLGFSAARSIALRTLAAYAGKVEFVRDTSMAAAASLTLHQPADLIFIDADHSYEAVHGDFLTWMRHLSAEGVMALHDSLLSPRRPDLGADAGPVRLVQELFNERSAAWPPVESADTLSVLRRSR